MVEGEFIGDCPYEKETIRTYYESGQLKSLVVRENNVKVTHITYNQDGTIKRTVV